jgi:hypothetical protein
MMELADLKQRAIAEGEALADRLAASIALDRSWFSCVSESNQSIRKVVEKMTSDPMVADQLARICAEAARTRLNALLENVAR